MNMSLTNSSLNMENNLGLTVYSVIAIFNQILNLSIGLPLNCYILFLLFTQGAGRNRDATFMFNQYASEILLSIAAPLSITCNINASQCTTKALGFFLGISMSARYHFQCCMCLECYLAVVHPITFLKYNHMSYRLLCVLVSWIIALSCAISSMFSFPQLPYRPLVAMHSVVFTIEIFCFILIMKALRQPGPGDLERNHDKARGNSIKRRAFKIIFLNLVVFLMQCIPLLFLFIFKQNFPLGVFNLSLAISMSVNFAAGFVHPVFFLYKARHEIRCL